MQGYQKGQGRGSRAISQLQNLLKIATDIRCKRIVSCMPIVMTYRVLEENAARLVAQVFESPHRVQYPYHNLEHTTAVVTHAKQISNFYALDEMNACIVNIAAWFHDIGQLSGDMNGHEERSVIIMENFFSSASGTDPDLVKAVTNCIMATKIGLLPQTLNEKILCDADTWHFGTLYFHETEFLVKKEMEIRTGKPFPRWHQDSLQLLKNHVYFTEYAQLQLTKGKEDNLAWLQSLIQSLSS